MFEHEVECELEDEREIELEVLARLIDASKYWNDFGSYLESLDPEEARHRLWKLENSMQRKIALAISVIEGDQRLQPNETEALLTRLSTYYPREIQRLRGTLETGKIDQRALIANRLLDKLDVNIIEDDHGANLLRFILGTLQKEGASELQRLFRQLDELESDGMADADEITSRSWLHEELERAWPLCLGFLGVDERGCELEAILNSAEKAREHLIDLLEEEMFRMRRRLGLAKITGEEENVVSSEEFVENPRRTAERSGLMKGISTSVRAAHPGLLPLLPREGKLVGMEKTIEKLGRYIESSLFFKERLSSLFPGSPPKGLILHGATGVGKTESVRIVARKLRGKGRKVDVYLVPTSAFLASGLGETDKNIEKLFNDDLPTLLGGDSGLIVLFDELDGIARTRSDTSNPLDRVLNLLFILLDQLDPNEKLLVIGTTNRFELLDPAIIRRLGLASMHYPLPDKKGRIRIWRHFLSRLEAEKLLSEIDYGRLAALSEGLSGGQIENVVCQCLLHNMQGLDRGLRLDQKCIEVALQARNPQPV